MDMLFTNRPCQLTILEPWDYGTPEPIGATILARNASQYLIAVSSPLCFTDVTTHYLLGELRNNPESPDLLASGTRGTYVLNLAYSDNLNEVTFPTVALKNFRSRFLLGEVIL
jgi:hypothetical protein